MQLNVKAYRIIGKAEEIASKSSFREQKSHSAEMGHQRSFCLLCDQEAAGSRITLHSCDREAGAMRKLPHQEVATPPAETYQQKGGPTLCLLVLKSAELLDTASMLMLLQEGRKPLHDCAF